MNYTKQVIRLFLFILIISFTGCIKNGDFDFNKVKDLEWNPSLAIPLVSSSLTITDMIKQTGDSPDFLTDQQGFVTLVYKDRLFSIDPGSMMALPPASSTPFSYTFTAADVTTINTQGKLTLPTISTEVKLAPAGSIRIDSLICGKGDLTLTIGGNVTNNGSITINIPEATKNRLPLNATFIPLANGSEIIDLSGYKFDLTKVAGKPGTFKINVSITLTNLPAGSITAGKVITLNFTQHTQNIQVLSGYFGQFSLMGGPKTENLNIFKNVFAQGSFILVDPYLKFTFTNSFGLPIQLRFTELRGTNTLSGKSLNLAGTQGVPNPINLTNPFYPSSSPTISTYIISNAGTNGELNKFLNIKPDRIVYNLTSLTNPFGAQSENFIRASSNLTVDVEVGLPLYGYAKNFAVQDTFNFKVDNLDQAQSLLLRSIIDNEFPLDARMQVFFTDANYNQLDSLVTADPVIIPAAKVNLSTGDLLSSTQKISNFSYPKARINKIVGCQKILVKALLNTAGSATQNIRIYNSYKLKVKLAVQAEIKKKI